MKKKNKVVIAVLILVLLFLLVSASERDYIPEVSILVSTDNGYNWVENLNDLKVGKPFLLMFEVSVRAPGFWNRNFGAKSIDVVFLFPKKSIVDYSITESGSSYVWFNVPSYRRLYKTA